MLEMQQLRISLKLHKPGPIAEMSFLDDPLG